MRAYGQVLAGGPVMGHVDIPTEPRRHRDGFAVRRETVRSPIPPATEPPPEPGPAPAPERAPAVRTARPSKPATEPATQPATERPAPADRAMFHGPIPPTPRGPDTTERRAQAAAARTAARAAERAALAERLRGLWADRTLSQQQIADQLGISVTRLQTLRREYGIPRRKEPLDYAEIVRLYVDERLSASAIAARLGYSPEGVLYALGQAEVERRDPGESHRLPDAVRQAALDEYAAGARVTDILTRHGIGETTLLTWVTAAGLPKRGRGRRRDRSPEAKEAPTVPSTAHTATVARAAADRERRQAEQLEAMLAEAWTWRVIADHARHAMDDANAGGHTGLGRIFLRLAAVAAELERECTRTAAS